LPLDPDLVAPGHTAIVLHEVQRGTVGDRSTLPALAEAAVPVVPNMARLVRAGRASGVQVVHCLADGRVDRKGSMHNTVLAARDRSAGKTNARTAEDVAAFAEVAPEIGVDPGDIVMRRIHGMSGMTDTGLDLVLRNLGTTTVVAIGVSLNIGIMALVTEAISRAYDVVVPRDAVVGVPIEYGEMVLKNSISFMARLTTVDELIGIWSN